jgi:DNA recombination protein RmuC
MSMDLLTVLLLAGLLAAVAVLAALALRGRGATETARLALTAEQLAGAQATLAGELKALGEATARAQAELARTLNERLDAVAKRVGDSLAESADKTGKSVAALHERLAVIDAAQANLTELSSQVVGLQDILNNKQARGAFGEVQLEAIVRDALPPSAYALQAQLSNGRRVDCLIRLPNPPGPIAVDAKFPLESWRALRAAADEPARVQAGRTFSADMQKHVDDIAERYILAGETAESALMFLPSEAIYADLHANFAGVVETARRRRVWIVSPTTLMAVLTTVRAVLKDARMREQAHVIQRQVGLLLDDVRRLTERVDGLKKHFAQAEKDIRDIDTSADKIARKAAQIEAVEMEEDGTRAVAAATARALSAE